METNNLELVSTLFKYNAWAFDQVWVCVDQLTDEQFCLESGYSLGSVRNQYLHVVSTTMRWIQRLQGLSLTPHLCYEDYPTILSVKATWTNFLEEARMYVTRLDEQQLLEIVNWELASRNLRSQNRRYEILLHLLNHSTDHRAQILAILHYSFHVKTIEQDLILYLSSGQNNGQVCLPK
jgi:uncharacterized damage-inducible protein DinB